MRPLAERLAVWLLTLSVVLAPLALGASHQWTRFGLELAVGLSATLWALSARRPLWLQAMPSCILFIALIQVFPLAEPILTAIAPVSAGAWKVAAAGLTNTNRTVSVDPHASTVAAARLFLSLSVVAVVASVARNARYRTQLVSAVVAAGVATLACGAVFGHASKDKKLLLGVFPLSGAHDVVSNPIAMPVESAGVGWTRMIDAGSLRYPADIARSGDGFGTYIYSNHFAGGITLTLPLVIAVWLVISRGRAQAAIRLATAVVLFGWAMWIVGMQAHSRAGAISLAFAGLVLTALLVQRPWHSRLMIGLVVGYALLVVAGAALVLLPSDFMLGVLPEQYRSFITVIMADARNVAAQVAMRMFFASPILGTGLDTYADIFPRFTQDSFVLFYAHNDVAQWLAETGMCGLGICIASAGILIARCRRFCRGSHGNERLLFAGAWAALAGIVMHSGFDWNLHLPANAFLTAVITGLAMASSPSQPAKITVSKSQRLAVAGLPIASAVVCVVAIAFLYRDAWSQTAVKILRRATINSLPAGDISGKHAHQAALEYALRAGGRMAGWDPLNSELAVLMGQACLHSAALQADPAKREEQVARAEKWFALARTSCAVVRGLPSVCPGSDLKIPLSGANR